MKIRIIPCLLTDGLTVIKGERFENWRTVGNAQAVARLFAARDVDELMFLDTNARQKGERINDELIDYFAETLDIPFSVGGGISSIEDARACLRNGAEKVVLGTSGIDNPRLISEIADEFGSQAVVVAIDVIDSISGKIATHSGKVHKEITALEAALASELYGAGEILLQSIEKDGTLSGLPIKNIEEVSNRLSIPLIAAGGANNANNAAEAIRSGASAVAIGALFQFTQTTPASICAELHSLGINVRLKKSGS